MLWLLSFQQSHTQQTGKVAENEKKQPIQERKLINIRSPNSGKGSLKDWVGNAADANKGYEPNYLSCLFSMYYTAYLAGYSYKGS